jgi:hypothetical protein
MAGVQCTAHSVRCDRHPQQNGPVLRTAYNSLAGLWEVATSFPLVFYPSIVFGGSFLVTLIPLDAVPFKPDFYSTLAQLLAVLLITLLAEAVLEAREFREDAERDERANREGEEEEPSGMEKGRFERAVAVIVTIVAGEVGALWSLATAPNWPYLNAMCVISAVVATAALLGPFLHRIRPGGPRSPYGW